MIQEGAGGSRPDNPSLRLSLDLPNDNVHEPTLQGGSSMGSLPTKCPGPTKSQYPPCLAERTSTESTKGQSARTYLAGWLQCRPLPSKDPHPSKSQYQPVPT
jgi:hypothetical protein